MRGATGGTNHGAVEAIAQQGRHIAAVGVHHHRHLFITQRRYEGVVLPAHRLLVHHLLRVREEILHHQLGDSRVPPRVLTLGTGDDPYVVGTHVSHQGVTIGEGDVDEFDLPVSRRLDGHDGVTQLGPPQDRLG